MPSSRRADLGAAGLAVVEAAMEGGWLLVVYAGFEVGLMRHQPSLGPVEFALAALLGIWIGRRPHTWPRPLALAALAAVVLIGWLASPATWTALQAGALPAALAAHPGALLLGAAVLRGGSHRDPLDDVETSANLLRYLTPILLLPWLVGAIIPDASLRLSFVGSAWMGTLVFVVAGFAALGFGRLRLLGLTADPRDRAGRTWFLVTAAVPLGLIAVGVPLALSAGLRPEDLAEAIVRPGVLLFTLVALLDCAAHRGGRRPGRSPHPGQRQSPQRRRRHRRRDRPGGSGFGPAGDDRHRAHRRDRGDHPARAPLAAAAAP